MGPEKGADRQTEHSVTRSLLNHEAVRILLLLIVVALVYLAEQLHIIHLNLTWQNIVISIAIIIVITGFGMMMAAMIARDTLGKNLSRTIETRLEEFNAKLASNIAEMGRQVAAMETSRKAMEESMSQKIETRLEEFNRELASNIAEMGRQIDLTKTLLTACNQLKDFMKAGRKWIVSEDEVYEIEKRADDEIIVFVPDFHYEEQQEYVTIIADNLAKNKNQGGPTYRYTVRGDRSNKHQWDALKRKLAGELRTRGIEMADQHIEDRFVVTFIDEAKFPSPVLFGLVIYTFKNNTERCFQYLPRELDRSNIEIPTGPGSSGKRAVNSCLDYLKEMPKSTDR